MLKNSMATHEVRTQLSRLSLIHLFQFTRILSASLCQLKRQSITQNLLSRVIRTGPSTTSIPRRGHWQTATANTTASRNIASLYRYLSHRLEHLLYVFLMTWKRFQYYWSFVRGIQRSVMRNVGCWPQQAVIWMAKLPMMWNALTHRSIHIWYLIYKDYIFEMLLSLGRESFYVEVVGRG